MHRLSVATFKSTNNIKFVKARGPRRSVYPGHHTVHPSSLPPPSSFNHPTYSPPSSSSHQASSFFPHTNFLLPPPSSLLFPHSSLLPSPSYSYPPAPNLLSPNSPSSSQLPPPSFPPLPGFNGLLAPLDEKKFGSLEKGIATKTAYQKFLLAENSAAGLALAGMGLAILDYDYNYRVEKEGGGRIGILLLLSLTTLLLLICLYLRNVLKLKLRKERKEVERGETLISSGQIFSFLIDCLLIIPHPNILFMGLHHKTLSPKEKELIVYEINDFMSICIIILRMWIIFRAFLNNTIFASTRSYRLCNIYDVDYSYLYSIKSLIKIHPLKSLFLLLIASTLIFAHALRVCEKPLSLIGLNRKNDLGYYPNALWCVVVTIYTIGYGDFYPRTDLGRFVSFFVEIWGNFLISMMVVAIGNILLLGPADLKVLTILNRLGVRVKREKAAAQVIGGSYKMRLEVRNKKISKEYKKHMLVKIKKNMERLKVWNRALKSKADGATDFEILVRNFEGFINELKIFNENQERMLEEENVGSLRRKTLLKLNEF